MSRRGVDATARAVARVGGLTARATAGLGSGSGVGWRIGSLGAAGGRALASGASAPPGVGRSDKDGRGFAASGVGKPAASVGNESVPGAGTDKNVLDNLLRTHDVVLLTQELEAQGRKRDTMSLQELHDLVRTSVSPPRSAQETKDKVKMLEDAGLVLVLEDMVYLHPRDVTSAVLRVLPGVPAKVYGVTTGDLEKMRAEFDDFHNQYTEAKRRAESRSRMIVASGLILLCCQLAAFVRLTYYEFSWDVMEPISYFVGLTNAITVYIYYLWNRTDFSYESWERRLEGKHTEDYLRRRGVDLERYSALVRRLRR